MIMIIWTNGGPEGSTDVIGLYMLCLNTNAFPWQEAYLELNHTFAVFTRNQCIDSYIYSMKTLHLNNSLTGLIILDSFGENVFFLMLLGGFMSSLPKGLEESASIDGTSLFQTFWRIIVPLSTPGIVTFAIFKFLELYNNFLGPFIYLSDPSKYTIGVNMYQSNMKMQYTSDWVTMFAGVVIVMVPSIIFYALFQTRIVEGATMGCMNG